MSTDNVVYVKDEPLQQVKIPIPFPHPTGDVIEIFEYVDPELPKPTSTLRVELNLPEDDSSPAEDEVDDITDCPDQCETSDLSKKLQSRNELLKAQCRQQESQYYNLQAQHEALQKRLNIAEKKYENLEAQLHHVSLHYNTVLTEQDALRVENEQLRNENQELKQQNNEFVHEKDNISVLRQAVDHDREMLRSDAEILGPLQEDFMNTRDENIKLREMYIKLSGEFKELSALHENSKVELQQVMGQNRELRKSVVGPSFVQEKRNLSPNKVQTPVVGGGKKSNKKRKQQHEERVVIPEISTVNSSDDERNDFEDSYIQTIQQPIVEQQSINVSSSQGDGSFTCSDCGLVFLTASGFSKHQRAHGMKVIPEGNTLYQCQVCNGEYASLKKMKRHLRETHEKTALKFPCKVCDKGFSKRSTLVNHMRIHTGQRPHRCLQCGKTFSQAGHLLTHKRMHAGIKPFQCKECEYKFTTASALRKHKVRHDKWREVREANAANYEVMYFDASGNQIAATMTTLS